MAGDELDHAVNGETRHDDEADNAEHGGTPVQFAGRPGGLGSLMTRRRVNRLTQGRYRRNIPDSEQRRGPTNFVSSLIVGWLIRRPVTGITAARACQWPYGTISMADLTERR